MTVAFSVVRNKSEAPPVVQGTEASMVREGPPQPPPYPADKACGGKIDLRRRWQRARVHHRPVRAGAAPSRPLLLRDL